MYKYTDLTEIKKFILSLDLIENKSDKDIIKILYTLSNTIENQYKKYEIPKKTGGIRNIEEPFPILKKVQRNLLNNYLYEITPSTYVKSYIKGITLIENARPHVGKKIIVKLDIENFFDNIDFLSVYHEVFGLDRMPKSVGMLLSNLCTLYGSIPQGAPTSAYISNLVLYDFDEAIGSYCRENGLDYTRYSDDMTISGEKIDVCSLIEVVESELRKRHLRLNRKKTHVIKSSQSQVVTGICVNEILQKPKCYRKMIRQEIYYIKKYGTTAHMQRRNINSSEEMYLRSLAGRIEHVLSINKEDKEMQKYKKYIKKLLGKANV